MVDPGPLSLGIRSRDRGPPAWCRSFRRGPPVQHGKHLVGGLLDSPGMVRLWSLLAVLTPAALFGCGGDPPPPVVAPFDVDAVIPLESGSTAALRLNQEITVSFSDVVDPLTVGPDTVRVLDAEGNVLPGTLDCGPRWVTFLPTAPRNADLSDGSFQPGGHYRIQIVGYPRRNAVRARDGRLLRASVERAFRVEGSFVPPEADQPFHLLMPMDAAPVFAVGHPRIRLHYSLPVLPSSVTPDAFEVLVLRVGSDQAQRAPAPVAATVESAVVPGLPAELQPPPGATVELTLRPPIGGPFEPGDVVYVRGAEDQPILDYGERPAHGNPDLRLPWRVVEDGDLVAVRWLGQPGYLRGDQPEDPGLVVNTLGEARPGCFLEMGTRSEVWSLEPGESLEIRGAELQAGAVRIPPGAEVRWNPSGGAGAVLRVRGEVRIGGTLRIVGGPPRRSLQSGGTYGEADLLGGCGLAVFCGGVFRLEAGGRIEVVDPSGAAPLAVVAHGGLELRGALPEGTVLGQVGVGRLRIRGTAKDPVLVQVSLTPGVAGAAPQTISAWTPWERVPPGLPGELPLAVDWTPGGDLTGSEGPGLPAARGPAVRFEVQGAAPDPIRPGVPASVRLPRPVPVAPGERVPCQPGNFLRFRVTFEVPPGKGPPPGIRSLRLIHPPG